VTVADLQSFGFGRVPDLAALCESVSELAKGGTKFVLLAGGTDFMVEQEMRRPYASPDEMPFVIDVSRMPELRGIEETSDWLRIGAATTFLEMRRSPLVLRRTPMIARMAADVGAIQIQARGTFGGNLATASPAADGVAALAAYDAVIVVRSARGTRAIPFAEYATGYKTTTRAEDEVIVRVDLPLRAEPDSATAAERPFWYWRKIGTRKAQAISKVALAGVAVVSGDQVTRCGLGMASVGPTTALLGRTRELFLSTPLSKIDDVALGKAVDADISPIDDVRSTRAYRGHVARAAVAELARGLRSAAS
jgi:CO/xanthine dehydrogenase FAD-binding subunit